MTVGRAAVVANAEAPFTIQPLEMPPLTSGQVLVKLEAVSMCHADLGAREGRFPVAFPIVLGHEGCGVVIETGSDVTEIRPGHRVVLTFDTCGICRDCRANRPARCSNQLVRDWIGDESTPHGTGPSGDVQLGFFGQSSFAEYAIAGIRNTIRVDTDLPAELLAPLGCGVQTGFGAVSNMLAPAAGDKVAVFGLGGVGLSAVMALAQTVDVTTVAVDPDPLRRDLAVELGASLAIDPTAADAAEVIRAKFPEGLQGAVECSGHPSAFKSAVSSVGQSGTVVLVGTPPFGTPAELDVFDVVLASKRILGCIEGDGIPREMIPHLVKLIEQQLLPVDRLIETYPFVDIERAAADMASGRVIKPVLMF